MANGHSHLRAWACVFIAIWCCRIPEAGAAPPLQDPRALRDLSLEQLGEIVVTSVDKQSDDLWRTAAAASVITADDIRRSGATSLPEVLRISPGVEVARIDTSHYSIGIRGFGEQFSKSVLVLVDGRNLYTQLFAGTYWPAHDIPLEDIERIEIIRGPGGTIWGGNAVNGVINVITKPAGDTRGLLASATTGSSDHGLGTVRFGGGNGDSLDYRVYARALRRGPQFHADGIEWDGNRWATQAGFRVDRGSRGSGALTLRGDIDTGEHGQRVRLTAFSPPASPIVDDPVSTSGGNLLARWEQRLFDTDVQLQGSYTRTAWRAPHFEEVRDTIDADYLQSARLPVRSQLTWGAGFRWSDGRFGQTVPTLDFEPPAQVDRLASAFIQDERQLISDRLLLTGGAKFEHNIYTGLEVQPTGRLLWRAGPTQSFWGVVTRAVRTPSRIERAVRSYNLAAVAPLPIFVEVTGSDDFDAERVVTYTAGYRTLAAPRLYVDAVLYYNDHAGLTGATRLAPRFETSPPRAILPFVQINGVDGESHGFEVAPDWRPWSWWRLYGAYSFRRIDLRSRPDNDDPNAVLRYEGSSPRHLVQVQSRLDLRRSIEFDAAYRYVSKLTFAGVPGYHSADARLAWRPSAAIELSVAGQNLLAPHHLEFAQTPGPSVGVARSIVVRATWMRPDR